jgi:putative DNA primase/helicase
MNASSLPQRGFRHGETWLDGKPWVDPDALKHDPTERTGGGDSGPPSLSVVPDQGTDAADYSCSDLGNAELLAAAHGERFRYVRARKVWLVWRDGRWREDETGEIMRAAKETVRDRLARAAAIDNDDKRQREARWALASHSDQRLGAMVRLASTEPGIVLAADELDRDPYLLACANGVIDLRTGRLRPHDPADLISLGTEISYDADATCPRWLEFLDQVFDGDGALIGFMQRGSGYALTGDTREHVMFVLHGSGRNGKTTYVETMRKVVGDFARPTPFDTFARVRDRGTRNDLAGLHRARLVVAAESGEGRKLDEATVKIVTGGDSVPCRFLYGEFFSYKPGYKIFLITNHRPGVEGDDDAIWSRIKLVPFEISFKGREDKKLEETLAGELPGILAWAVRGCLAWQRDGLGTAPAVETATSEYREDEDVLGAFLAEHCREEKHAQVLATDLRTAYDAFCKDIGEKPISASALGKRLTRRGVKVSKPGGTRTYHGIRLENP